MAALLLVQTCSYASHEQEAVISCYIQEVFHYLSSKAVYMNKPFSFIYDTFLELDKGSHLVVFQ